MENFYRNSTWILLLLISLFTSFWGTVDWKVVGFKPYLGVKTFLILSIVLLIANIPEIITMFTKKDWSQKNDE